MMTVSARTVYYSTSRDVQIYTRSGHLRKYSNTLFFIDKIKTCASHMTPGIISADWRMNGFSIQFAMAGEAGVDGGKVCIHTLPPSLSSLTCQHAANIRIV